MKVAILGGMIDSCVLAGQQLIPKPMVEVGGKPILWHIMMMYSRHGFDDFAIALGYKGEYIKKYVIDFLALDGNLFVDLRTGAVEIDDANTQNWKIHMLDSGSSTPTGDQIRFLWPFLGRETFALAWGDAISDIDLTGLLRFHCAHGKLATLTLVRPLSRSGYIDLNGSRVMELSKKHQTRDGWINGGFFVFEPDVIDYIDGHPICWEQELLQRLAKDGQLMAFYHDGFWQCVDTMRDKAYLEELWESGKAPWKAWK